jgi:peptidoglycan hydrolase-like protein with peptidoglycan-binding domain
MVTGTAALAAAAFMAVAFVAVAFAAVAFAAVGDASKEPVYQGSAGYTDQLVEQISAPSGSWRLLLCSIDRVSGSGTRRSIREYERAHSLPEDGKIGQQLLTTMGLS